MSHQHGGGGEGPSRVSWQRKRRAKGRGRRETGGGDVKGTEKEQKPRSRQLKF